MVTLEEAKKVILAHLDEICTVKKTRWVLNEAEDGYIEVDAGFSDEEMKIMRQYHYRDMKKYFKLRDKIDDLI